MEKEHHKRQERVVRGGMVMAGGTFLSRVLGFLREILAARYFGAGSAYDAFVIAFSVPNLFRRILGEEMHERAFMPRYRRMEEAKERQKARQYVIHTFWLSSLVGLILVLLLFPFLSTIIRLLAPGLSWETHQLCLNLTRYMLFFIVIINLFAFTGAMLLFQGRKFLYSIGPAFINLVVLAMMVFFHRILSVKSLVFGFLLGGFGAFLFQAFFAFSVLEKKKEKEKERVSQEVRQGILQGSKIFTGTLFSKSTEVVDRFVASLISPGAISFLWYSWRLIQLPFALFSLSFSRSLLPELSALKNEKRMDTFGKVIAENVVLHGVVLLPISLFCALFAKELIALFFQRGAFTDHATQSTALAFFYYSLGLLPMGLVGLLGRVYAVLEENTPVLWGGAIGAMVNIGLDFALYKTPLHHGGIALATSIAYGVQVLYLAYGMKKHGVGIPLKTLFLGFGRIFLAFLPLAGALFLLKGSWVLSLIIGTLVYSFAILILFRLRSPGPLKVVLTGGGTSGHVYPNLAILEMLKKHVAIKKVLYIGAPDRAEGTLIPQKDTPFIGISAVPFPGLQRIFYPSFIFPFLRGMGKALIVLLRFRPHLILASGGYVSAPVVVAGALLKPVLKAPIVLHEQNLVPGLFNKVGSLLADVVLVSFPESAYFTWSRRCILTGYPLRRAYLEEKEEDPWVYERYQLPKDTRILLFVGGSLGSRTLNRLVVEILPQLIHQPRIALFHSIGMQASPYYHALEETRKALKEVLRDRFNPETLEGYNEKGEVVYRGFRYLEDLIHYQRAATLVVSRAGAGALMELASLKKPVIFIPKRGLPGDHQELNAIALAEKGACEVLFEERDPETGEERVDPSAFLSCLFKILEDEAHRKVMGEKLHQYLFKDPEKRILQVIQALLQGESLTFMSQVFPPRFVQYQHSFDSLIRDLEALDLSGRRNNLYAQFYQSRIEEYLASPDYLIQNKAIKIIGVLELEAYYPYWEANFPRFQGFIKRNILSAIAKAQHYHPLFERLIDLGLRDAYWEVRREAIRAYRRYYPRIAQKAWDDNILKRLFCFWEHYEVKQQAIQLLPWMVQEGQFYTFIQPFKNHKNMRLREAILEATEEGIRQRFLKDKEKLKRLIQEVLVVPGYFRPAYPMTQKYKRLVTLLEELSHD